MTETTTKKMTTYLLTADIGGTNSRMFLYDPNAVTTTPLWTHQYRNAEYIPHPDRPFVFSDNIITPFLEQCWEKNDQLVPLDNGVQIVAVLAVAGVVNDNRVELTNLGNMVIDGTMIAKSGRNRFLKAIIHCRIINDFVAQGYGCLTLKEHEVRHLYGPSGVENLPVGPKVCVGAGTGLGECYLTPDAKGTYTCFPSEGGHVEFAPRNNDVEISMFRHLVNKFAADERVPRDRISVERVVSGKGLANVYQFLADEYGPDEAIHEEFLAASDQQGRVVAQHADVEGSRAQQAMQIMMKAYGCEVGSAAINWVPKGGLFVSGGLTPKNIKYIEGEKSDFMTSYRNKGRVQAILEGVPLFAVLVEDLGVRGAHKAALIEYGNITGNNFSGKVSGLDAFLKSTGLVIALTASISVAAGYFLRKRA